MESTSPLTNYLELLLIRQKAYRRNLFISGGLLLFGIAITVFALLLTEWNIRTLVIVGVVNVSLFSGYLMTWTRLEVARENIELVKTLLRREQ